ncbi:MAG: hypothetical protein ABEK12_03470 [Candidatus Nanohaloarchaea archaeon]
MSLPVRELPTYADDRGPGDMVGDGYDLAIQDTDKFRRHVWVRVGSADFPLTARVVRHWQHPSRSEADHGGPNVANLAIRQTGIDVHYDPDMDGRGYDVPVPSEDSPDRGHSTGWGDGPEYASLAALPETTYPVDGGETGSRSWTREAVVYSLAVTGTADQASGLVPDDKNPEQYVREFWGGQSVSPPATYKKAVRQSHRERR